MRRCIGTWVGAGLTAVCLAAAGVAPAAEHAGPVWDRKIGVHGALRAMMHEGQVGPTVELADVLPAADLYAVGALASLAGEVTVVAGRAYLSYPVGESARTDTAATPGTAATLLVTAHVPEWRAATTGADIPFAELDEAIASLAAAAGLTPDDRFPFLVEGEVVALRWHVIDGSKLAAGPSTHEAHAAAGVKTERPRARATLVGFYSPRDQGVFTHMGSRTHVHCVLADPVAAGHVDHVVIPAGTTVRFPTVAPPGDSSRPGGQP